MPNLPIFDIIISNMTNQGLGLIGFVILLIIAIIVLGFFGISLTSVFQKQGVQDNLSFARQTIQTVWNRYLAGPAQYLWNIFYNLLWQSFVQNASRIKEGKTPTILEGQPQMNQTAPAPAP